MYLFPNGMQKVYSTVPRTYGVKDVNMSEMLCKGIERHDMACP